MGNVVQLEAFEAQIRGKQLRWFLVPDAPISYPPGFQEQCFIESPPFQRKILLTSHTSSEAWCLVDKWDAIVKPSTGTDWSICLSLVLNQPYPCIVCITPEVKVPAAFFQKCKQANKKAPTIVCFQVLKAPVPHTSISFDATFFPPSTVLEESCQEATSTILQQTLHSDIFRQFNLKDAVRDLKGAGATLIVSSIEDSIPTLYWYYAVPQKSEGKSLLASVVQTLLLRS